jgi:hypothetical protein
MRGFFSDSFSLSFFPIDERQHPVLDYQNAVHCMNNPDMQSDLWTQFEWVWEQVSLSIRKSVRIDDEKNVIVVCRALFIEE